MPAFGPINENVFTTEGWILLGPPVHKPYGWLPLITVLLETCVWSGSTVACLAPEKAPMCFPWIVGNQQGFRLPGNSIMGLSSWGGRDYKCTWMGCFLYLGQRKRKEVYVGDSKESSHASYLEHRAYVQTPTSPGRYLPVSLNDAISVDSDYGHFYFVLFMKITCAA